MKAKEAKRPNELWQVGFTKIGDAEIITALDDYSRFCLGATPFKKVGVNEVCYFLADILEKGVYPEAILTKNSESFFNKRGESNLKEVLDVANIKHFKASMRYGVQKLAAFFRTMKQWF